MILAPDNDGPGLWGAALLGSLGLHAALVVGLMAVDPSPPDRDDRDQVANVEILLIERLGLEVALPTGVEEAAEAEAEEIPPELLESETPPPDPAEDAPEDVDAADPDSLDAALPELAEETVPDTPEALESVEEAEEVTPETAEAPDLADTEEAEIPPEPVEPPDAADAPEEVAEIAEALEPEVLEADAPDVPEEIAQTLEEEAPESAEIALAPPQDAPDIVEATPDFTLPVEEAPDILSGEGAGGLAAGSGPAPIVTEAAPPVLEAGPQVGIVTAEDLSIDNVPDAPELEAAPELPEEIVVETPPEVAEPEDLVIAALPPELEPDGTAPPVPEPEAAPAEAGLADPGAETNAANREEMRQLGQLVERIRLLSDRSCLVALPRRHSTGISVEVVGAVPEEMERLQADVFEGLGIAPAGVVRRVAPAQCAVLDFLRDTADYPVARLGIGVAADPVLRDATRDEIEGMGRLQATVVARPGWQVTLLMIDDAGVLQDLTEYLTNDGTTWQLDVPVRREGDTQPTRQILLALASAGPLSELRDGDGTPADIVLGAQAAVLAEVPMALLTVDIR